MGKIQVIKKSLYTLTKVFLVAVLLSTLIQFCISLYDFGYQTGYIQGQIESKNYYENLIEELAFINGSIEQEPAVITKERIVTPTPDEVRSYIRSVDWGGPELWEAVNKKRQEYGVNPLRQADELCTIASIRLNELIALGTLDGHEGFSNLSERREDLQWIFEKYSSVSEFLALGASSADATVSLWDNTLAHKKLLTGGEYVWGCVYAQNSFAVAITSY